jgi:hypothetical protein
MTPAPRRPITCAAALAAAAAGLIAVGVAGCTVGDQAADLFAVTRSGAVPGADFQMVPRSDGTVSCNGKRHLLPADLTVALEDLQPLLEGPATKALNLPSGPQPVMTYSVLTPGGHFSYSDTSPGKPPAFDTLDNLTTQVARRVCGLPR